MIINDHKELNYELVRNDSEWKVIRTSCDCLSDDHIMGLEFEYEKELDQVILSFNYKVSPSVQLRHDLSGFFVKWKDKLKFICKILFDRPIKYEESFIFRGQEHINEIADAMKQFSNEI